MIDKIIDVLISKDSFLTVLGGFVGAFFAYCFFILSERWRSNREMKIKRKQICIKEHAYLERYFQYLIIAMEDNIRTQEMISNNYKIRAISCKNIKELPVREDSSMKLLDFDFLNKIQHLMIDIMNLNDDIEVFNTMKNKMNDNIERFVIDQKRDDLEKVLEISINKFLEDSEVLINFQKMQKDIIFDLAVENVFLFKKYKMNFVKKVVYKFKNRFVDDFYEKEIEKRKEDMQKEIKINKKKAEEMYKKYNIIK